MKNTINEFLYNTPDINLYTHLYIINENATYKLSFYVNYKYIVKAFELSFNYIYIEECIKYLFMKKKINSLYNKTN